MTRAPHTWPVVIAFFLTMFAVKGILFYLCEEIPKGATKDIIDFVSFFAATMVVILWIPIWRRFNTD